MIFPKPKFAFIPFILLLCSVFIQSTAPKEGSPKYFALFFAIDDYDEWSDLRNPIKDALAIANDLQLHYSFEIEIVKNPSQKMIFDKLGEYRRKSYAKNAQLLIFFSGHGDFIEDTEEGFFIPKDGRLNDEYQVSYLPHTRLERAINNIPCNHILLAIDACYSGTFDEAIALSKGKPGNRPSGKNNARQKFIEKVLAYKSRLYLTSGGKERTPDGKNHSPFTQKFLEALRSFGGDDGILSYSELCSYMERANPIPRAGQFGDQEAGGSFLFVFEGFTKKEENPVDESEIIEENEDYALGKKGILLDKRNGQKYPTIQLAGRTWMAENLNYDPGVKCWFYNDNPQNAEKCGRLYTWVAAMNACPKGWHIPTQTEWSIFVEFYKEKKYKALFPKNSKGLEALFCGYRIGRDGSYNEFGIAGLYWSSTEGTDAVRDALGFWFSEENKRIDIDPIPKTYGLSCRCIKD